MSTVKNPSSHNYVAAYLREKKPDRLHGNLTKIDIRLTGCEHVETVCHECLDAWKLDWEMLTARTAGGRRLEQR